jgi:hypothetical protein
MYRTDCDTAHPVLLNQLSKVNNSCGPAQYRSSFMSGELKGGEGYHILMSDWRVIMTPQKATLNSMRTLS